MPVYNRMNQRSKVIMVDKVYRGLIRCWRGLVFIYQGRAGRRCGLTIEQGFHHIKPTMHTCIVQRYPSIYIGSAHSNHLRNANAKNERVAVDRSLMKAISLVDIIFSL